MKKMRGVAAVLVASTLAAGAGAALGMPAGASVARKNPKVCNVLSDTTALLGENAGTRDAGKVAVKLYKRAAKVAPAKVKSALNVVAASYQRIVDGKSPVSLATDRKFLKARTVVSRYVLKNCTEIPSSSSPPVQVSP